MCSPETSGEEGEGEGVFWGDNYVCGRSTSMYRSLYNSHYVDFGLIFFISPDQSCMRSR